MKLFLTGLVLVLATVIVYFALPIYRALPTGTGFSAKYICSSLFVSGRDVDPAIIVQNDIVPIDPSFGSVDIQVDYESKTVTSKVLAGLHEVTAVFRNGLGCTLAVDTSVEALRVQASGIHHSAEIADDAIWPHGQRIEPNVFAAEIDRAILQRALEDAFAEPAPDSKRNTLAVVVIYRGQLVAEHYAPGFDESMPLLGWSMSKSLTNALVGVLVQAGKLELHGPAPVPEWQHEGDARKNITLDQLLRMSSGLAFAEDYVPGSDASNMLFNKYSAAAFAASKPLAFEPDEHWEYSSGTTNIISRIIRETVGGTLAENYRFAREGFFDRIGMHSATLEPDASGSFVGSSYSYATARDWARFGLLYLNDGVWQGDRILPEGWVAYSKTPTPRAPQGQYGAQFWLNAGSLDDRSDRVFPDLPADAFWASGFSGQSVFIIPSRELVVVRLGTTLDDSWNKGQFVEEVLSAFPH